MNSTPEFLDPLEMLLDAARHIEPERPKWANAAREAVASARLRTLAQGEPQHLYELSDEDYEKFVDALGGNKPPTQALIDLMRGYRDNQTRAAQQTWQPINTAPRDKTILAIRAEWWTPINGDHRWVFSAIRETNWLSGSERWDFGDGKQPTHWMPRPNYPTLAVVPDERGATT